MAIGLAKAGAEVVLAGRDQSKADDILATIKAAEGNAYFLATDLSE